MARKRRNRTSGRAVAREYASTVRCTACCTEAVIFRPRGQVRQPGHRKHVHCFTCQRITLHIELGPDYVPRWSWPLWGRPKGE